MKRILAICLAFFILLCGCAKNTEMEEAVAFPLDESKVIMGESLSDYTAAINGKVFCFPLGYSDFATLGFTLDSSLKNATLKAGQYSIYKVNDGDYITEVYIANLSDTEKELTDCTVCGVVSSVERNVQLILPKDISFGASMNSVTEKYGSADKTTADTLIYGTELEGAKLGFEDGGLHEIYYYRIVNPEDLEFSNETPKEVKAYKDPEYLSNELSDFTFYLYGTTYTMPLPVSRMIKAGWIKVAESGEYLPANATVEDAGKLTAANRTLTLGVRNIANYPTSVENCYVTGVKSTTDVKLDLTLANGCRVGSTTYNLENTFGKDNFTSIEKKGGKTKYIYIHKGEAKLTVIANESGIITEIKIELI